MDNNTIYSDPANKYVLLMGVGNYLMGDEGIGVHVARQLSTEPLPPGTDVLDGGTGGFHLTGILEQYPIVILIDATIDGHRAGTIRLLEPRFASDFPRSMSTHDVGLRDVLEALQITGRMPKVYLITVSVEELQPMSVDLSPAVQKAALEVITQVKTLLWEWWDNYELNFEMQGELEFAFT
ncbi:MAG: hydrogenase maturation protease [Bacteroidetes bacterium]|nr:MAG: hydrogenase maturation protease [Bacteroidota bacterium]